MRRLMFFALALFLAGQSAVWASGMPQIGDATTTWRITATVYNDSGSALTSGSVVVWDTDDTELDNTGYPYITTTTTADDDWVAGVVADPTCPSGGLCDIVVYGWALTLIADSTDAVTEDQTVATSTVAGRAGDWDGGANECYLGLITEDKPGVSDDELSWVFVNPSCED